MTICIAAIATNDDEEFIIFATDHMVSSPVLGGFEHPILKYRPVDKNCVAMLSGVPVFFDELTKLKDPEISFSEKKNEIYKNFLRLRRKIIKREILDRHGITKTFFLEVLKMEIPNAFIGNLLKEVINFKLKTSILMIGFDDGLAMISEIDETGEIDYRDIAFHAIGSGTLQAMNTLLFQKHSRNESVRSTLYNVYKAKRNAEVAEGVGFETELIVLTKEKGLIEIDEHTINLLKEVYEKEQVYGKSNKKLKEIELW